MNYLIERKNSKSAALMIAVVVILTVFLFGSSALAQTSSTGARPASAQDLMERPVRGFEAPARLVRAKGWAWDHEVRIWLPSSYKGSGRSYPTLWVTDNSLEPARVALAGASAGLAPEMILVAVGA